MICLMAVATVLLLALACGCRPSSGPDTANASNTPPGETLRGDLIVPLAPSVQAPEREPPDSEPSISSSLVATLAAILAGTVADPTNPGASATPPADSNAALVSQPFDQNTNEVLQLRFNTLSSFPYSVHLGQADPNGRPSLVTSDEIPPLIRTLDGRRVAVTGYVMPLRTQGRGVTQFLLARDQLSCCFGPSPQMNHWIYVTMPRGDFRPRVFSLATVTGTLRVGELMKNGVLQSIYQLAAEKVEMSTEIPPPIPPPTANP